MTASRKIGLLALAVGGCLTLALNWHPTPKPAIYLSQLLPQASSGPLLSSNGTLGSFAATPFLGAGWDEHTDLDFRTSLGQRKPAVIRFYLSQIEAVMIDLEGRSPSGPAEVQIGLGQNARTVQLENDWTSCKLELPANELKVGLNQLFIRGKQPTQWRNTSFRLLNSASNRPVIAAPVPGPEIKTPMLSPTPNQPSPTDNETSAPSDKEPISLAPDQPIKLAFGNSLEFPVLARPGMNLVFDGIEPWIEPGAPSLKSPWTLKIRMSNGKNAQEQQWEIKKSGSQKFPIQVDKAGQMNLSVMAQTTEPLLPGQAGLLLRKARLESSQPSPSPTQTPEVGQPQSEIKTKPNVILVVVDTLRSDALGCYGAKNANTPHFDALAADGVRFANCMAQSSWTKSAMASIMTATLPQKHLTEDFPDVLAPWYPKLSKLLLDNGYDTRAIVSNPFVGKEFGFADGFEGFLQQNEADAHQITRAALGQLEKLGPEKPFFLYLHVLDPHLPYSPPAQFRPKQGPASFSVNDMKTLREGWEKDGPSPARQVKVEQAKALYAGEITSCDRAFGALVAGLKKRGLYENSLVIVVSDHGEQFFEHGLCDHMNSLYQELLHVPLLIKFPAGAGAGKVVEPVWQHIDITPTVLKAAGIQAPIEMQGLSYTPNGPQGNPERSAYFSLKVGLEAAYFGQSPKDSQVHAKAELEGVRVGPWVLQRAISTLVDLEPLQLFNLQDDPGERTNLAFGRPDLRSWMTALLAQKSRSNEAAPHASRSSVDASLNGLQYLR
jgi:choline-sulfatase